MLSKQYDAHLLTIIWGLTIQDITPHGDHFKQSIGSSSQQEGDSVLLTTHVIKIFGCPMKTNQANGQGNTLNMKNLNNLKTKYWIMDCKYKI